MATGRWVKDKFEYTCFHCSTCNVREHVTPTAFVWHAFYSRGWKISFPLLFTSWLWELWENKPRPLRLKHCKEFCRPLIKRISFTKGNQIFLIRTWFWTASVVLHELQEMLNKDNKFNVKFGMKNFLYAKKEFEQRLAAIKRQWNDLGKNWRFCRTDYCVHLCKLGVALANPSMSYEAVSFGPKI